MLASFVLFSYASARGEDLVSTKEGEPEGAHGFKIRAFVNPGLESRDKDSQSGIGPPVGDDGSGFVLRRSNVTVEKQWSDSLMKAVLGADVIRNHRLSKDTAVDGGKKADPYLMYVSSAFVQKNFYIGPMYSGIRFGIQEAPYMYSEKKGGDITDHVMAPVPEDLRFTPDRSDLGLSLIGLGEWISFQFMIANGEGALRAQGDESYGFDAIGRISFLWSGDDALRFHGHLYFRKANVAGYAGNECREGKGLCLSSDNDLNTNLSKDLRSLRDDYYGAEGVAGWKKKFSLPFGVFFVRDYGGRITDLAPGRSIAYDPDRTGRAFYLGLSAGTENLQVFTRVVEGTGSSGRLSGTTSRVNIVQAALVQPAPGLASPEIGLRSFDAVSYQNRSSFRRWIFGVDFALSSASRIAFGVEYFTFRTASGDPGRIYVDPLGSERTRAEYLDQYRLGRPQGISELSANPRHYYVRAGIRF